MFKVTKFEINHHLSLVIFFGLSERGFQIAARVFSQTDNHNANIQALLAQESGREAIFLSLLFFVNSASSKENNHGKFL